MISFYQITNMALDSYAQSTVTALLEATDNWTLNIDQVHVNAVVFSRSIKGI